MGLWDSLQKIFSNKKQTEDAKNKTHSEKTMREESIPAEEEMTEQEKLAAKAFKARRAENLDQALDYWNQYIEKFPDNKPQAMVHKARIYILKGKERLAREELFSFFGWYCSQDKFNYNSRYFTIFISSLQDLGYLEKEWSDSEDYLKNIAGEDISLDKTKTTARINTGLECLKEEGIWSKALEQVRENLSSLSG